MTSPSDGEQSSAVGAVVHDRAAIVSSGDEIITGQLLDTNAHWIAQRLLDRGIIAAERATIGDDAAEIASTLGRLAARFPLVVMTGGLGPTEGDLTRQGLAVAMGEGLVRDEAAHGALAALLARRGRELTELQARQAMRPVSARCLPNAHGTAPGLWARLAGAGGGGAAGADVICLPGPPGELKPMWVGSVEPLLRPPPGVSVATRLLRVVAMPEAEAVRRLGALMARDRDPLVGVTASAGVLTLRMRARSVGGAGSAATAEAALDADEAAIRSALGDHVLPGRPESVAAGVVQRLAGLGRRLAVAESCTGGLLGATLAEVPGASAVFVGGWVCYANERKVNDLRVPESELMGHGAVSAVVARRMASGALEGAGADHALSITGIAGPEGGSAEKPVGTVFIGHAWREGAPGVGVGRVGGVEVRRFLFPGGREDVRARAAQAALAMVHLSVCGSGAAMIWQLGPAERW